MPNKDIVSDIVRWIEENSFRNLKANEIVEASGFSRTHINRIFKEKTHMNLGYYKRIRRLSSSAVALKTTDESVEGISRAFGFDSTTSYILAFKKHFSLTPGKFRETKIWSFEKMIARYDFLETIRHLEYKFVDEIMPQPFLITYNIKEIIDNLCEGEDYNILIGNSLFKCDSLGHKGMASTFSLCTKELLLKKETKWLSINVNIRSFELNHLRELLYEGLLPHIGIMRNQGPDMLKIIKKDSDHIIFEYLVPCVNESCE